MEKEGQAALPVCAREVLKCLVELLCSSTQTSERHRQKKEKFFFQVRNNMYFFHCVAMVTVVSISDFKFSKYTFFRFPVAVGISVVDCSSFSPSLSLGTL